MSLSRESGKVVRLDRRRDESTGKRSPSADPRVIAVTGGKGGVGKTGIVANLGYALGRLDKKVIIFDADLGLGNIDLLLGIAPRFNIGHFLEGSKSLDEILVKVSPHMTIVPASSGLEALTRLTAAQQGKIFLELQQAMAGNDFILVDTAAGLSSNVIQFNMFADEILVVVSPEPASMTDAYALMKVLSMNYGAATFHLLLNMARHKDEADEAFRQLKLVTDRFLDVELDYLGFVPFDEQVNKYVKRQKLLCEAAPESPASRSIFRVARKVNQFTGPRKGGSFLDGFTNGGDPRDQDPAR
jgi:flagellar biosynthesis protein FlhG